MSTPQLNPYLVFNGNCREAMTFYQQCLGGELQVQPFAGTPAAEHVAPEVRNGVLHAALTNGNLTLFASDTGLQQVTTGSNVALALNFSTEADTAAVFQQLAAGGTVTMLLEPTFWSAQFGMLTDRFGTDWMLNCDLAAAR